MTLEVIDVLQQVFRTHPTAWCDITFFFILHKKLWGSQKTLLLILLFTLCIFMLELCQGVKIFLSLMTVQLSSLILFVGCFFSFEMDSTFFPFDTVRVTRWPASGSFSVCPRLNWAPWTCQSPAFLASTSLPSSHPPQPSWMCHTMFRWFMRVNQCGEEK